MNLPTWTECSHTVDHGDRQLNPLEQFVFDNEPAGHEQEALFREQLQAALDFVTAPRTKKAGDNAAPRATKRAMAHAAIADQRPDWVSDPIVTGPATPVVGKTWKGSGRFYMDGDDRKELGSWSNPAGDVEAARLTKETGTMHLVDPRTGEIISMGGEMTAAFSSTEMVVNTGSPATIAGESTVEGFMPVAKS